MKRLYSLMLLLSIMTCSVHAASVKVTMNATSPTMTLTSKSAGTMVEVGEPANKVYSFQAETGTYVLTAYATDGTTVNGTIELNVTDQAEQAFAVTTITAYATNSGWTLGTDYDIETKVASKAGTYEVITTGQSTTAGRITFLMFVGDTYYCDYVPSETRTAEGFATGYKTQTMTAATGNASLAIPAGIAYSVSVPATAEFFMGRKTSHYAPFIEVPATKVTTEGNTKTYSYVLANAQVYNFRTWKSGGLTNAGYFTASTTATKMPVLAFTDDDYATSPQTIRRDNLAQTGDIMLNINEQGFLQMTTGQKRDITGLRSWQATDTSTNNYYQEPSFHFTVINEQGVSDNSVVTFDSYDTTTSPWTVMNAVGKGTAIVLVTYDAINLNFWNASAAKTDYMNGPLFGAIWPENTGVFVVSVDQAACSASPCMTINTEMDSQEKNAGQNIDAEHDIFYYLASQQGASYTFQPKGVSTVSIASPTIGEHAASYNGFAPVAANADGSYTLILKQGRNIVKLTDASGNATYQVLTAKPVECEISNLTTGNNTAFAPGDKARLTFATLYHPANKMSGVYNMSATLCYENGKYQGTANQYAFASTEAAQTLTFNVPMSATGESFLLQDGNIKVSGFGDPYGNHRLFNKTTGRNANFTALQRTAYFGQLPEVELPIHAENIMASVSTNAGDASITITRADGSIVAPEAEGQYRLNYYGTYCYKATAEGFGTAYGSFEVKSGNTYELAIDIPAICADTWDGSTTKEPALAGEAYQISNGQELAWLAENVNNGTAIQAKAVLTKDIDLAGFEWTAIGNSANKFAGSFDGQGHTVRNLCINNADANYQGLFGMTAGASIQNTTIDGYIHCDGTVARVGALVGQATDGSIANCHNRANITAYQYIGGIVGYGSGALAISRCSNTGTLTGTFLSSVNSFGSVTAGTTYVGGIVGYDNTATATITDCYNQGNLSGANYVGGITGGMNAKVTISRVFNTGNISTTATYVGAIRPQTNATATSANVSEAYAIEGYFNETNTTIVSRTQMASGEVAYKLGKAWGQNIGTEPAPVLGGMKVYEADGTYTNDNPAWKGYEMAVLTFEDKDYKGTGNYVGTLDWSTLIDDPQYGGLLLYGDGGMGVYDEEDAYTWNDDRNTYLTSTINNAWGSWCYWNGGAAISNYGTAVADGGYETQLGIPYAAAGGKHGHNGSDNFAVCYGYEDNSGYGSDSRTVFTFSDGQARVIDHAYINNTAYFLNSVSYGDGFNSAAKDDTYINLVAQGYDKDGKLLGTASLPLVQGKKAITEWTRFDLSGLGQISTLKFDFDASADQKGDYGLNAPAYFAIDDIAVRMPAPIQLADKSEYDSQDSHKADLLTYTRTFGTTNWQPLYVPFTSSYADWSDDVVIAKAVLDNGDYISIQELAADEAVEANTPLFIKARATGDVTINVTGTTLVPAQSNSLSIGSLTLTGIYSAQTIAPDTYSVLHEGQIVKTSNAAGYSLPAMRWYASSNVSEIKVCLIGDDTETAIEIVDADSHNEAIYNISGARQSRQEKGINIVTTPNGAARKVMVK